jgi:hypothetical protein
MAAAAAINSSKKRKRPHSFETNPSIRRRQQTRLLRKLRQTIDEYATRVGQQAIVLIATPGKPQNNFRVFGAKPLEDVVKNVKSTVLQVKVSSIAFHFVVCTCLQSFRVGFGNGFGTPRSTPSSRRSIALRATSASHRRNTYTSRENDASPAASIYSADAQVFHR